MTMTLRGKSLLHLLAGLLLATAGSWGDPAPANPAGSRVESTPVNLIFILADDLGYGDLGCYGQKLIQTPHLDRMAAEGVRFTRFYAGSTVCAPSRAVLMTGQHAGHTWVRGNDPKFQTLRPEDFTVAELFRQANYHTAMFGKWGLGEPGTPGHPLAQGFQDFLGYLNQAHAHNYYPAYLDEDNGRRVLRNKVVKTDTRDLPFDLGYSPDGVDYAPAIIWEEAMRWLGARRSGNPYFLYLTPTLPHANNEKTRATGDGQEVPDYGIYADRDWKNPDKGQAAMITLLDQQVGELLDLLRATGQAENTLVLFTSDNGPHKEGGNTPALFNPSGGLRGMKRDLYEGGIRVPLIAWSPGRVPAGQVTDHIGYFGDLMATAAELTGQPVPGNTDGVSFLPTLLGQREEQRQHEYLYWEFYERGQVQAVLRGDWKAVRKPALRGPIELYHLAKDPAETNNVADQHPEVTALMQGLLTAARQAHPHFKFESER